MTPVVILRPRILAKKCKGKMFKNFLLKNYNAPVIMEAFSERVDLNCLYCDLRQILWPHERRFNLKHRYLKTKKLIQNDITNWCGALVSCSLYTFEHDIDTLNTFCIFVVWNQELHHGVQLFKLYHNLCFD